MTLLAPRIGNEVPQVRRTSMMTFILRGRAQYLVRLEGGFTCSTHWK